MKSSYVFPDACAVTFRGIDHHEGSGLGEICGLCLESPSCVVSAERDMQLQLRLTGRPVVQFPVVLSPQAPCNVRPTHCNRALSTRAFGHPTCWPVQSFLPVPTGLSISLGNSLIPSTFRPLANLTSIV